MTPEHSRSTSTRDAPVRRTVRHRIRKVHGLRDHEVPVWWPEYVDLYLAPVKGDRIMAEMRRRRDLATWLVVRHRGAHPSWLARRLGVSLQRMWNMAQRGERAAERSGLTPDQVADLLLTPVERLELSRKRRRDRAQRLEERLAGLSLPDPPNPWHYPWLQTENEETTT